MNRRKKTSAPVELEETTEVAASPSGAPRNSIVEALRRFEAEEGTDRARGLMIDTVAACIQFGIELDGPQATIRLFGDTVIALQSGIADAVAARFASKH